MLSDAKLIQVIQEELAEDSAYQDVTARLLSQEEKPRVAAIKAKQTGVFCGEAVVRAFDVACEAALSVRSLCRDGQRIESGDSVVLLKGQARTILSVERTLINFVAHLSGVATTTRSYVDAVGPLGSRILATRKTLPGLRRWQLQAVEAGGGLIHRRSLSDGILIKENHLRIEDAPTLIGRARLNCSPLHGVEIEVQSLEELDAALKVPPDVILLDNLPTESIKIALEKINKRCLVEVSGGMTQERASEVAALGVNYISVGKLTHSAPSLDLSLDFVGDREWLEA